MEPRNSDAEIHSDLSSPSEPNENNGVAELATIMAGVERKQKTLSAKVDNTEPLSENSTEKSQPSSTDDYDEKLDYVAQNQSDQLRKTARRRPTRGASASKSSSDLYTAAQAIQLILKMQFLLIQCLM